LAINSAGQLAKLFQINNPDEWTVSVWVQVSFTPQVEPDRQFFTIIDALCEGKYRKRFSYSIENNWENQNSGIRIGSFINDQLGYIPTTGYGSVPTHSKRWVNLNISSSGSINPGIDWSGEVDFRWVIDGYSEVFVAQKSIKFDDVRLKEVRFADLAPDITYSALRVFDVRLNDVQILQNANSQILPEALELFNIANFPLNSLETSDIDTSGNDVQILNDGYANGVLHDIQPPFNNDGYLSFDLLSSGIIYNNDYVLINNLDCNQDDMIIVDLYNPPTTIPRNITHQISGMGFDWYFSGGKYGLGQSQGARFFAKSNNDISDGYISINLSNNCDFIGYCVNKITSITKDIPITNTVKDGYNVSIDILDEQTFFGVYFSVSNTPATAMVSSNMTVEHLLRHDDLNIAVVVGRGS
jgi:hypothetical protein